MIDKNTMYEGGMSDEQFGSVLGNVGQMEQAAPMPTNPAPMPILAMDGGMMKAVSNSSEHPVKWGVKPLLAGKFTHFAEHGLNTHALQLGEGQEHEGESIHVGTLGDLLAGSKIRHLYHDALDTPVVVHHRPHLARMGGEFQPGGRAYNRETGRISLNLASENPLHDLLHEGAHALRYRRTKKVAGTSQTERRLQPINPSASFQEYEAQPHEKSARRMANYAMYALHEEGMAKSLPLIAIRFAGGVAKAVRDTSGEARVPKGKTGAGRWQKDTESFNHDFKERLLLSDHLQDTRTEGHHYLFAKIKKTATQRGKGVAVGRGVALVNDPGKDGGVLTPDKLDTILDEAKAGGYKLPVYIHATANTAAYAPELYSFQHLQQHAAFADIDRYGGLPAVTKAMDASPYAREQAWNPFAVSE